MLDETNLLDLQRGILGAMMLGPEYIGEVCSRLRPELFDSKAGLRQLYDTISGMFFEGVPIDAVTVQQRAGAENSELIKGCIIGAAVPSSIEYYCKLILEYSRLAQIQRLGSSLSLAGSLEDADKIVDELNGTFGSRKTDAVDALELIAQFASMQSKPQKKTFLRLGMQPLDEVTFIEPGDLVVVGGYASAGKTLLSLQFALELAKYWRVGYFSLETSAEKMGERMLAHLLQISLSDIKRREISSQKFSEAIALGAEMGRHTGCLKFHEAAGSTVRDIQAAALSSRYDVIFVDYLQIVEAPGVSTYERVTSVSKGLHALAQKHKITVIALAQLSRPEKTSKGQLPPPSMWSFKESGQIENDADVAMLLYPNNPNDNRSTRHLKVSKNKDGERCEFDLEFFGHTQTLKPIKAPLMNRIDAALKDAEARQQVSFTEITEDDGDLPF